MTRKMLGKLKRRKQPLALPERFEEFVDQKTPAVIACFNDSTFNKMMAHYTETGHVIVGYNERKKGKVNKHLAPGVIVFLYLKGYGLIAKSKIKGQGKTIYQEPYSLCYELDEDELDFLEEPVKPSVIKELSGRRVLFLVNNAPDPLPNELKDYVENTPTSRTKKHIYTALALANCGKNANQNSKKKPRKRPRKHNGNKSTNGNGVGWAHLLREGETCRLEWFGKLNEKNQPVYVNGDGLRLSPRRHFFRNTKRMSLPSSVIVKSSCPNNNPRCMDPNHMKIDANFYMLDLKKRLYEE